MKKMLLLIGAGLLAGTLTLSAQTVRLNADPDYDVYIDDRHYGDNATITTLADGQHTVDVYQRKGGFLGLGKKRTLVNTGTFRLRNNDILIETDANGQLRINELGNTKTMDDRNRRVDRDRRMDDRDDNYAKTKKGRGYGPYDNPGKGNKYGLYKNKKNKKVKDKSDKHHDDDDDRYERRDRNF